jgi:hypothetical protein
MTIDVDHLYPHLSALAKSQRTTLNELGKRANPQHNNFIGLADCCWIFLNHNKYARWANAGSANYLATLDEHLKALADLTVCKKFWRKLVKRNSTSFLDTVVEAAWAIYLRDKGYTVQDEVPFDPTGKKSKKDADLVVTIDGKDWWLDAFSMGANQNNPLGSIPAVPFQRSLDTVVDELAKKACNKYDDKFKAVIRSGLLKGSSIGVLLCVIKREQSVIPKFFPQLLNGTKVQAPLFLFDTKRPSFDLVWVHTLRSREGSDILKPYELCKWMRKG